MDTKASNREGKSREGSAPGEGRYTYGHIVHARVPRCLVACPRVAPPRRRAGHCQVPTCRFGPLAPRSNLTTRPRSCKRPLEPPLCRPVQPLAPLPQTHPSVETLSCTITQRPATRRLLALPSLASLRRDLSSWPSITYVRKSLPHLHLDRERRRQTRLASERTKRI